MGLIMLYQKFLAAQEFCCKQQSAADFDGALIMSTIQFILMGLLAELLVRTYHESQAKSAYIRDS